MTNLSYIGLPKAKLSATSPCEPTGSQQQQSGCLEAFCSAVAQWTVDQRTVDLGPCSWTLQSSKNLPKSPAIVSGWQLQHQPSPQRSRLLAFEEALPSHQDPSSRWLHGKALCLAMPWPPVPAHVGCPGHSQGQSMLVSLPWCGSPKPRKSSPEAPPTSCFHYARC